MKTDIALTTRFIQAWRAQQVGFLVSFGADVEGLVSLVARNAEISVCPHSQYAHTFTLMQDYTHIRTDDRGWHLALGDVYASRPCRFGIRCTVDDPEAAGSVPLADVEFRADVIRRYGVERLVVSLPMVANLDGQDHIEPHVVRTLLRFPSRLAAQPPS